MTLPLVSAEPAKQLGLAAEALERVRRRSARCPARGSSSRGSRVRQRGLAGERHAVHVRVLVLAADGRARDDRLEVLRLGRVAAARDGDLRLGVVGVAVHADVAVRPRRVAAEVLDDARAVVDLLVGRLLEAPARRAGAAHVVLGDRVAARGEPRR